MLMVSGAAATGDGEDFGQHRQQKGWKVHYIIQCGIEGDIKQYLPKQLSNATRVQEIWALKTLIFVEIILVRWSWGIGMLQSKCSGEMNEIQKFTQVYPKSLFFSYVAHTHLCLDIQQHIHPSIVQVPWRIAHPPNFNSLQVYTLTEEFKCHNL